MSKWFRKNPLFATLMALCVLLILGELGLIYERWAASRAMAAKFVQRQQELMAMRDVMPPPTREVAKAVEADWARAQQALAAMEAELKGRGPAAERLRHAKVPAARTDAYFDLASFVEKMRELAKKHDVDVRPEAARFGFAAYANEGPDGDTIEPVFRQRLIAQYLIEALLEAKPRALLLVKRGPPVTKKEREERDAALAAALAAGTPPDASTLPEVTVPDGPDFFAIDPRGSARVPGYVDATAFRLVFTGQTAALRQFLNRLAGFELPVLVREVEVEPATVEEANAVAEETPAASEQPTAPSVVLTVQAPAKTVPKKAAPRASAIAPIVSKPLSKFTVTVEYIDLVTPPPPPADPNAPAPST
ncbi:MAG TPA: Amuc_1100 family pilus-like protein [Opitutaceae bacterium]|nr:Amuc_1100 family pilus-like protein [Opitutaceae bacterium]